MIIQTVRSDNGGREGKWVALCILIILTAAAVLLPFHQQHHARLSLASHQIALKDVDQASLGLLADLRLAHEEIRNIYLENIDESHADLNVQIQQSERLDWEPIDSLKEQWLAPFVEDKSWDFYGKHQWTLIAPAMYQGLVQSSDQEKTARSFILVAAHQEPELWIDLDGKAKALSLSESVISDQALIDAGWSQVVFEQATANGHVH
ncbi:hypothetical protein A3K86_14890 [Photobacterium jeanii]|uniref:Uncharacterized protein n=1 Tax=Photobacterium jeanii TaxID=858640 RepID=A0A178K6J5_9GAMM|nr:hypothetical protein [Photobacterium jeanii]OAN12958.1 hypothetical protein A3K86_14890 [Photobacterium jeanii]PST89105.1 hypothetical protein C9I91_13335 [Photobacterium jeanii]